MIADALREFVHPLRTTSTLLTLLTFTMLIALIDAAGMFGLWLLLVVLPALTRYLVVYLEARARDLEPPVPDIDMFSYVSNAWSLFPVLLIVPLAWAIYFIATSAGTVAAICVAAVIVAIYPASLAVLAITHSPLQSLNPAALGRLVGHCGVNYALAPATVIAAAMAFYLLPAMPGLLSIALELYLAVVVSGVTGAVIRHHDIIDDVELPEADIDEDAGQRRLERQRRDVLTAAYGFASRGNRDGALQHVYDWLARDPAPAQAWPLFFESMTAWDDPYPGLLLAQQYVGRLLDADEKVAAVKLMTRCRMINADFRPLSADLEAAVAASESLGNRELADALRR